MVLGTEKLTQSVSIRLTLGKNSIEEIFQNEGFSSLSAFLLDPGPFFHPPPVSLTHLQKDRLGPRLTQHSNRAKLCLGQKYWNDTEFLSAMTKKKQSEKHNITKNNKQRIKL